MTYPNIIYKTTALPNQSQLISYFNVLGVANKSYYSMNSGEKERLDQMIEEMLIPQQVRALRSGINAYNRVGLPQSFISKSRFTVAQFRDIDGGCDPDNGDIYFDSNAISGFGINTDFLFGHELGHKIMCMKSITRREELHNFLEEISSILKIAKDETIYYDKGYGIESFNLLEECICDVIQRKLMYISHC